MGVYVQFWKPQRNYVVLIGLSNCRGHGQMIHFVVKFGELVGLYIGQEFIKVNRRSTDNTYKIMITPKSDTLGQSRLPL